MTDQEIIKAWDAEVAARVAQGKSQASAIAQLVSEDPEMHQRYLAAYNRERQSRVEVLGND